MARPCKISFIFLLGLGALAGCSPFVGAERPAWRTRAEEACFAKKRVAFSPYIRPARHEIDGPSICGMTRPLKVTALQDGAVMFNSTQTLDCSMTAELNDWLTQVVQPAAQARFGEPVVEIYSMGAYNCRSIDHKFGARLSEHSFGNAIDIGGYRLADGRNISYVHDWWRGDPQTEAFLRDVSSGSCGLFTTVLSPGANPYHYNHMHIDLAMHGMTSTGPRLYCRPRLRSTEPPPPRDDLPPAPEIDDDMDVSQAGAPVERGGYAMHSGPNLALVAATLAAADPARRARRRSAPAAAPASFKSYAAKSYAPDPAQRGIMRSDGVYAPEGSPSDFDLHPR